MAEKQKQNSTFCESQQHTVHYSLATEDKGNQGGQGHGLTTKLYRKDTLKIQYNELHLRYRKRQNDTEFEGRAVQELQIEYDILQLSQADIAYTCGL